MSDVKVLTSRQLSKLHYILDAERTRLRKFTDPTRPGGLATVAMALVDVDDIERKVLALNEQANNKGRTA